MTYIAVYAALLLGGGLSVGARDARKAIYFLALAGLFIFVAFRFEVGCDWTGYLEIFTVQGGSTIGEAFQRSEPLFWAANGLLHRWRLDYPFINVIAAAVYFLGFHVLARRQPDRLGFLILSFPLLIMHLAMSGIRQAMAVGILCAAFAAFTDRRLGLYVGLVLLAAGFHTSALIFLALVPFVRGSASTKSVLLRGAIALPGLLVLAAGEQFGMYYARYLSAGPDALGAPFRSGLLSLVGAVFILFLRDRWQRGWPHEYKLYLIGAILMLFVFPAVWVSPVIGDRIGYYLMPLQLAIAARLAYLERHPFVRAAPYAVGGAVLVIWVSFSSLFQLCYVPYSTWLLR